MSISDQQSDAISRDYDNTRMANKRTEDLRKREVYSRVPRIAEIDTEVADASVSWLRSSFGNMESDISSLKERLSALSQEKVRLLAGAGFPEDYLDPIYTCCICKDTGWVEDQRCTCFKKKYAGLLFKESNLKNAIPYENFSTFNYAFYSDIVPEGYSVSPRDNIKKAVEKAKNFVHNFDVEFSNLLITGNTGVGKTFLCNCIAKELMEKGRSVVYQTEYELFDFLADHALNRKKGDELSIRYDCIMECDLLIIDDMGVGNANSLTVREFFTVLNERLLKRKSTLISTNLHFEDIKNVYSERILSRIIGSFDFIEIYGKDIRALKKFT